ncbi:hypothetical protein SK128_001508, partial [Halocaridina rubra]
RNECAVDNGGCSHECRNTVGSFMCCCPPGQRLMTDKVTCQDVNECENHNGGCSHRCVNTQGSYECRCEPHQRLLPDNRTCIGE